SPGPAPGNLSSHDVNKVPWCVALDIMLRRSYAKYAYLKSLVLHKDQVIRAADPGAKTSPIWAQMWPSDWALWAGRAGAPEALPPARDDLPVVDVVRNATLERGDHRARGPGYALPQLASLGVGGGVGREQQSPSLCRGESAGSGSSSKASMAAPRMRPSSMARARAFSSTTLPRAVLSTMAFGF